MNALEFLQWGERYHYPQLVLGEGDVLSYGHLAYYGLVESDGTERLARAIARVEAWEVRVAQAQKVEAQS